jgi:hypothetical protein
MQKCGSPTTSTTLRIRIKSLRSTLLANSRKPPTETSWHSPGQGPRDAVRRWFTNPKTPQIRLGFYGLLLGLCGDADDARRLEIILSKKSDQFRLGLDGMIFGYLLLEGNDGMKRIED